nr:uncharacterized protein LOC127348236 [Lolium perenne]
MAREFEALDLNGHNYPTWAMDTKIALASRGIVHAIQAEQDPLPAGVTPLTEQQKYTALYIIRHHIHPDIKSEYLEEESPSTLFQTLKTRYEQQKAFFLPKALHDWTHLRLRDFKSIGGYNHEVHKISSKLRFCEKEPTDAEKIEKTLSTMLPSDRILQQQYRARDYQNISRAPMHLSNFNCSIHGANPVDRPIDGARRRWIENVGGKIDRARAGRDGTERARGGEAAGKPVGDGGWAAASSIE